MKKKITTKEVEYVANLANLPLNLSELKKFTSQLSEVIDYNMSLLKSVETKNIEPTAHVTGDVNKLRRDEVEPGLSDGEALQNAKEIHNNFFKVKTILDLPAGRQGKK